MGDTLKHLQLTFHNLNYLKSVPVALKKMVNNKLPVLIKVVYILIHLKLVIKLAMPASIEGIPSSGNAALI